VILKRISIHCAHRDEKHPDKYKEVSFLTECLHLTNIVKMIDSFVTRRHLYIIFLKTPNSIDLFTYVMVENPLHEKIIKGIFLQCISTVMDLQILDILHGDIKDDNILITIPQRRILFIDFGAASRFKQEAYTSYQGAIVYAPPEWVAHKHYHGDSLNVWQLGTFVTIFILKSFSFFPIKVTQTFSSNIKLLQTSQAFF
jgi:serine/threonine protein kinase